MVRMPKNPPHMQRDSKQSSTYLRSSNEYNNKVEKNKEKKCNKWEEMLRKKYIGKSEIIVPVPVASCRAFSAVPTAKTCPMLLPIEIYTSTSPPRAKMGLDVLRKNHTLQRITILQMERICFNQFKPRWGQGKIQG